MHNKCFKTYGITNGNDFSQIKFNILCHWSLFFILDMRHSAKKGEFPKGLKFKVRS